MAQDKRVYSEIIIEAPVEKVWQVITDFDAYPQWNRFTPRITLTNDRFSEGAEFDLDCRMTDKELLTDEHEMILEIDRDSYRFCMGTSRTKGRPGIRSFRWQICEPLDDNRTRYINYEKYEGWLAPLVRLLYDGKLAIAFEQYCQDLKQRVESLQ